MTDVLRWFNRFGIRVAIAGGLIGVAWILRQTQGALLAEVYALITRPFYPGPTQQEWVQSATVSGLEQALLEAEAENRVLRQQLALQPKQPPGTVLAPIIGRSVDSWWQQVTLGRGSRAGVQVGDSVSGPGGLVGRIVSVSPNTSRVLLITDPSSGVGVMISRSRSQGYIRGQGTNQVTVRFFDRDPVVRPGDVAVTSSASTLFPAGLPVGVVQKVDLQATPAPEAVLQLSAPIGQLEWLTIQRSVPSPP
ncbi:rod shape-determining protein MreC [Synechococcus elongatus]|uniref:Cell shape-determining protein MreC n=1 Tax=Synechococcus elongatus PCC 11801 TaxID=2219813 RepID=A0AAN1QLN0_SYNEL|nr:rod shape-determining protein MreC [Synechococcus elongatus]AZB71634.1 rod shape-determining protein MreC [Synechococcus elongatus PCC 11801]